MTEEIIDIYSDESGWDNSNQYGTICLISGRKSDLDELSFHLKQILLNNSKEEIKFKDIKNDKSVAIVQEIFKYVTFFLSTKKIKLHIICWDKKDSRHKVLKRDDRKNLMRMYYHITNTCFKHWSSAYNFNFYPDEFNGIDWNEELIKYLTTRRIDKNDELFNLQYPKSNNIKDFEEAESNKSVLVQVCDLFAGAIRTSRCESKNYQLWINQKKSFNQFNLFDDESKEEIKCSKQMIYKFKCLDILKSEAENNKLGLNFSSEKYFKTFNNKTNLFVFHYQPQHELDKAPTK